MVEKSIIDEPAFLIEFDARCGRRAVLAMFVVAVFEP
jgi:hypothetical protein